MNRLANDDNVIEKSIQEQGKTQRHIIRDIFKATCDRTSRIIKIFKQENESVKETKDIQEREIDRERENKRKKNHQI